jgi:hypothetical protein
MTGSFLPMRASRYMCLFTMLSALQTALPVSARADADTEASGLNAVQSAWGAFSIIMDRCWSGMAKTVGSLSTPDLISAPVILTTRRACLGLDGRTSNDCSAAVSFVCRQHGFEFGRRINISSGQVCRLTPQGITQATHAFACKPKIWLTQVACW